MKPLGTTIAPRVGLMPTRQRPAGPHREIARAFDTWQRGKPIRPGSAYYSQPPTSSRNVTSSRP